MDAFAFGQHFAEVLLIESRVCSASQLHHSLHHFIRHTIYWLAPLIPMDKASSSTAAVTRHPPSDLPHTATEQLCRFGRDQFSLDHLVQHVQPLLFFLIQRDLLPHLARVTESLNN